jgi:hypothetical protein
MYKILSKILGNRLRRVISSLISEEQSTFVHNRQILDGALIANDVVYDVIRRKKSGFIFKVDYEKAYDSVN